MLWIDLWVYARHHPDTAVAQRRFHRRWRQTIEDIVREGMDAGEWTVDDPADVSQRLSALTDGLAVHMVLGDPEHTPERYVSMSLPAAALVSGRRSWRTGQPGFARYSAVTAVTMLTTAVLSGAGWVQN